VIKQTITIFGILAAVADQSAAQNFPTKPITMVIPFAAGGPTDVVGRVFGQRMGEILGQQIVIENVGGAGGQSGSRRVADANPDGYTIVLGTVGTHAQGQTLYKRPLYNAVTDFTPIALLAEVPIALIVRKDLPANSFTEFVTYAKANHAKMQYGSAGAGAASHLACVLLNYVLDTNIAHVPYRGTGPATQDLVAGRIDLMCQAITAAKAQIDGGTVKALALLDAVRSPALPNVPTALEQGTKGLEAYTWNALFLPNKAPAEVVKKLNDAALQAMKTPAVRERLGSLGAQIATADRATPEYLASFVKSETEKWAGPIKASGVIIE